MTPKDRAKCLNLDGMATHLAESGMVLRLMGHKATLPIVIRGSNTDFALAAIHMENDRLVLDLGDLLDENEG
jgi:hypothetical protein